MEKDQVSIWQGRSQKEEGGDCKMRDGAGGVQVKGQKDDIVTLLKDDSVDLSFDSDQ